MRKFVFLTLLLPLVTIAQKDYPAALDLYMASQNKINDFSGAVLVAKKGKVIYAKAFGLANREWNVPNTLETKFRIASITKQFTAASIMQLAEKGKLTLEDKLSKYFPDFPKGDSVTIHMLLNHTSGIKSFTGLGSFGALSTLPYAKDSVVALFKNQPYEFSPGTKYNYNNSGYFLLGYIIEKVSKLSYSSYIDENIVKRSGLQNTGVNRLDSILANRASGYSKTASGWKNADYISMEFPYSAGAIFSTVTDLYHWQNDLFDGKIVSATSLAKMTTPYLNNYGYGLEMDSLFNHRRIGHSGGIPGFNTKLVRYPADEISIVVLSNDESEIVSNGLAAILLDKEVEIPYQHKEVKISADILNRYVGKYRQANQTVDTLIVKEGKLFVLPQGGGEYEFKAESATKFFFPLYTDINFQFDVDKQGKMVKAYFIEGGIKSEIKKL